jgi:Holliday junction resolvasome RuvABC endonuclease subunit
LRSAGIAYPDATVIAHRTDATNMARVNEIVAEITGTVAHDDVALAVIEGYAYAANTAHAAKLIELGGIVRYALWDLGCRYVVVAPKTLKKVATGNGNANKYAVIKAAERHFGYAGDSDDEADALWLRAIGVDLLGFPACEWTKAQDAGMATVRKNYAKENVT